MNRYQKGEKEVRELGEYNRSVGSQLAISVGTAIPIEETISVNPKLPKTLWFNLHTLARNYDNSYSNVSVVKEDIYLEDFQEELFNIYHLLEGEFNVLFYLKDLSQLVRQFPEALIKQPSTEKQFKEKARIDKLVNSIKASKELPIKKCKIKLPEHINSDVVVLTHHAVDLLSRYQAKTMTLLSSHTGALRSPANWIKTITDNENYHHLPFNVLTLQTFGDRSVLFKQSPPSIKKVVLELASKYKWKPTTTLEKVKMDIGRLPDNETKAILLKMTRVNIR